MSNAPLVRHPKCSALYARHLHRSSQAFTSSHDLDPSVAYLASVTVEVTTSSLVSRDASTFALTVHDAKSNSTWRLARSYTECCAFKNRILMKLSRGHLCFAECPWLYAYVQRSLPSERKVLYMFRVADPRHKPRALQTRRQALAKLFATLQRVLLNPLNQNCSVLRQQVAPEMIMFITNRENANNHESLKSPSFDQPLAKTFSETYMFEVDDEDAADKQFGHFSTMTAVSFDDPNEEPYAEENSVANAYNVVAGQLVCCAMCALHKMQSDEQVFACWRAETVISRFTRRRDEGGDEKNITFDKRLISIQLKANSIDACESAASPHCELSPLKLRGSRAFENGEAVGIEHDGTPKDPFPGSPCTPCTPGDSTSVFSNASSVREIDHEMLDNRRLSSSLEDPHTAKVHVSQRPGFANIG